jgi:DNA/RNA endonuclease YhcR with UshA esterase domain
MKKNLLAGACLVISTISFGQTKISIDSVSRYAGQKVTVCSEVFGVKTNEKVTYINLGAAYPKSPLTIVIFAKDLANFPEVPAKLYGNQPVCITGTIKEYKGKYEVVVTKPEEITVQ